MVLIINVFLKILSHKDALFGLIFPFLLFYAEDFEIKTSGYNKTDIVKVKARKIYFWINPFLL